MTNSKVLDLDAALGLDAAPQHTKRVKLLGEEWTIVCDLNSFAATNLASGDVEGVMNFIRSMILPEEWPAFARIASMHPALAGEEGSANLIKLVNALTEVAGERPTTPSSISPRGGSRRTSSPKSAASSSAAQVARSPR